MKIVRNLVVNQIVLFDEYVELQFHFLEKDAESTSVTVVVNEDRSEGIWMRCRREWAYMLGLRKSIESISTLPPREPMEKIVEAVFEARAMEAGGFLTIENSSISHERVVTLPSTEEVPQETHWYGMCLALHADNDKQIFEFPLLLTAEEFEECMSLSGITLFSLSFKLKE